MRAGRLDRLIDIQRATVTQSDSGEEISSWQNIATRRHAALMPVQGYERFSDPQIVAQGQVEFRIRLSSDVADVNPKDRIIYPAIDPTSPETLPDETRIYNILSAEEIGRREGLRIIAKRFADMAP